MGFNSAFKWLNIEKLVGQNKFKKMGQQQMPFAILGTRALGWLALN